MLHILLRRGYDVRLVLTDTKRIVDWNEEVRSYRDKIHRLIVELKLDPYVRIEQPAYDYMPNLYNNADIVVYPTVGEEPYGLVPLEAMSCGRPVVASRSGGIVETIIDGTTGYIVEKDDPEALSEKVAKLLNDRTDSRRFGDAGRQHVERNFSANAYTSDLLRRYTCDVSTRHSSSGQYGGGSGSTATSSLDRS
jgi:glycosyltransferase involved in cell wall biosynthesis